MNINYNYRLKKFILEMLSEDINKRPTSFKCYDEIIMIEQEDKNGNYYNNNEETQNNPLNSK